MSVCRSSRQLLSRLKPKTPSTSTCARSSILVSRPFHSTTSRRNEKPPSPDSKAPSNSTPSSNPSLPEKPSEPATAASPPVVEHGLVEDTPPKTLVSRTQVKKAKLLAKRADEIDTIKEVFQPYSQEQFEALAQYYTPQQLEALKAGEQAVDTEDLAAQWGPRRDQWRIQYVDDLSRVDPLVDQPVTAHVSDPPEIRQREGYEAEEYEMDSPLFNGLSIIEMLYMIEKRQSLSSKVKQGLRTLYRCKNTHQEFAAKRILWTFLPHDRGRRAATTGIGSDGRRTVRDLFEVLDTLVMDEVKKHEMLALRHWCGSAKEEALRPMLERHIEEYAPHGMSDLTFHTIEEARMENLVKKELGYNPNDILWFDTVAEVPDAELWERQIYSAVMPSIPKIIDPRVTYTDDTSEDAQNAAYVKLAQKLGVSMHYLRNMRVKQLVLHRVVNQTRQGKIQSMYSLSIAGNGDGLIGIGEGKSAEVEDAMLQSRINALRNLKPIHRYENRTIYGTLDTKVGGTTVQIMSRPPGKNRLCLATALD